jgi:hypothetical protein
VISISVEVDIRKAVEMLNALERELVPRAASAALNRVAVSARAVAVQEIARVTGLTQAEVRQHLDIRTANRNYLAASISAKPWSPNIIRFAARQTKAGVSAAPWRNRRTHKGTFIGNQGRTVFVRTSRNRLPIKAVHGPNVPREFMQGYALAAMQAKVAERFALEFERALAQFMRTRR